MRIAAVVPAFRCKDQIVGVLRSIGSEVDWIILVDDGCPDGTGEHARAHVKDSRLKIVIRPRNGGVGAAVKTGIREALSLGADIVVKLDGDGQMDARLIPRLVEPIRNGFADVAKGNRFWDVEYLSAMPWMRLLGNSILSFVNKAVSGYWGLMDPTNGFIAWHRAALGMLRLDRVAESYFFESDMLYQLGLVRAVIQDVPMRSRYGDEKSGLRVWKVVVQFPPKYARRLVSRVYYRYVMRDFNLGSIALLIGGPLTVFGFLFGASAWLEAAKTQVPSTSGTVMLAALPMVIGVQLLAVFGFYDILMPPKHPLQLLVPKE
ncbi:MAG TPA: DPM/DPG synthase family glycosyltransferase [Bdellovibrionota bacterium]|nr:DPM/DPG synthase family glycosyltransferase [Bdellovibrionota bacterium]